MEMETVKIHLHLMYATVAEMVQISNIWWSCFVIAVSSLVEAYTDQIDNLILPFVAYILFSVGHVPPNTF